MKGGMFITAIAVAGLACAATWTTASAASSTGKSVQAETQQIAPTHTKATTKTKSKRSKVARPQTNWLNPQPEPPSPAGNKPIQGGTWLNPQPEPPRPDAAKKVH